MSLERERNLCADTYWADSYFSREQWLSHLEQINAVSRLGPTSILEVGCGNGLVSWALKKRGFPVQTVDINPSLEPDFVGNVVDLPQVVGGRTYDLVLCAEVSSIFLSISSQARSMP